MRLELDADPGEIVDKLPDLVDALLAADPTATAELRKAVRRRVAGEGHDHPPSTYWRWKVGERLAEFGRAAVGRRHLAIRHQLDRQVFADGALRKALTGEPWLSPEKIELLRTIIVDQHLALAVELYGPGVLPPATLRRLVAEGVLTQEDLDGARALGLLGVAPVLGQMLAEDERVGGWALEAARTAAERRAAQGAPPPAVPPPASGPPPRPAAAAPSWPVGVLPGEGPAPRPAAPPAATTETHPAAEPSPPRVTPSASGRQSPPVPAAPAPAPPPPPPPPPGAPPAPPRAGPPPGGPTPSLREYAARAARNRGGALIVGLGNKVAADLTTIAVDSESARAQELRAKVAEAVAQGIEARDARHEIRRAVTAALEGDYARDIDRIVATEVHAAMQQGYREQMTDLFGPDLQLAMILSPDACPDCQRLYTSGGVPRIFRAADLPPTTANFRQKAADRVACLPPLHPWCGCSAQRVPPGFSVDAQGVVRPPPKAKAGDESLRKAELTWTWGAGMGGPERPLRGVLPDWLGEALWTSQEQALVKGAGHKYVRRIPTGDPKRPWKYFYSAESSGGVGHPDELRVGARFSFPHGDQEGHVEIVAVTVDGVRIRRDETGAEALVPAAVLTAILRNHHLEEPLSVAVFPARGGGNPNRPADWPAPPNAGFFARVLARRMVHGEKAHKEAVADELLRLPPNVLRTLRQNGVTVQAVGTDLRESPLLTPELVAKHGVRPDTPGLFIPGAGSGTIVVAARIMYDAVHPTDPNVVLHEAGHALRHMLTPGEASAWRTIHERHGWGTDRQEFDQGEAFAACVGMLYHESDSAQRVPPDAAEFIRRRFE